MSKVLFDQNVPRPLAHHLSNHDVTRTAELSWERLQNGKLLDAAEAQGFDVFVSADQNLPFQQNLAHRSLGIVVLTATNWPLVEPYAREILAAIDRSERGSLQVVQCGSVLRRS